MLLSKPYRHMMSRFPWWAYIRGQRKSSVPSTPNPNSYWVVKDRFLAGEYPSGNTAGEARHKIKAFLEAGITAFIDLTVPKEMFPYGSLVKGEGIEYRRFPISDDAVPTDPRQMAEILDAIDAAMTAGRKVYVHCQAGVGRTGTVVACWLQRHGRSPGEALRELRGYWRTTDRSRRMPSSPNRPVQVAWVKDWTRQAALIETALQGDSALRGVRRAGVDGSLRAPLI